MNTSPFVGRHGAPAVRFVLPLLVLLLVLAGCSSDSVPRMLGAASGTRYWVNLRSRPHLEAAQSIADFTARGQFVVDELQRNAAASQGPLISFLEQRNVKFEPFWITNSVLVDADEAMREEIARLPEVESIEPDEAIKLDEPQVGAAFAAEPDAYSTGLTVEWNVKRTHAPEVWDTYSAQGAGVVVGVVDTGFAFHAALNARYRGYKGTNSYDHNYNWHDSVGDTPACVKTPCDQNGHGTHVTGTVLGRNGTRVIGVAPEAKFISCRALNKGGSGTWDMVIKCYQWFMEPTDLNGNNPDTSRRPQIVSQSLGGGVVTAVNEANKSMVAAGILSVAAAGNTGGCGTMGSPAGSPDALTVGALQHESNVIASFSTGGPGVGVKKPDVVAGGQQVTSAWPGNGYNTISGTSMATPAVSGVAALVMSAVPYYKGHPGDLKTLLTNTANKDVSAGPRATSCGAGYPNNVTGWGEIDAYAAVVSGRASHP